MTRLANDLAALPNLSGAELRAHWQASTDTPAPAVPDALLRRLLAQHLQERRYGRLPVLVARELERSASGGMASAPARPVLSLTPGTRLVREWNGTTISVEVNESGFSWNGRTWRSLSEIARMVTGAHWSGPRFFGLRRNG